MPSTITMSGMGSRDRFRIALSGSYGGMNLGDEAILQTIIRELRRSAPVEITVLSRDAEHTRAMHDVDRALDVRKMKRVDAIELVRGVDLFILGGGGILYDADAARYLREVDICREYDVPVMVYAIGAGPLWTAAARQTVRRSLNRVAVLTVRDRQSQHLLDEIGVRRDIVLSADPALLLAKEPLLLDDILRSEAIDPKARLIGFSVREPGPAAPDLSVEHYHALVANAADFVVDRLEAEVVFFPLERRSLDVQHSHGVVARMRNASRATVLKGKYTPGQIVSLLEHFEFAVGMRLHFLIFAALAERPFVALPYAGKVRGWLEELDLEMPPLADVSAGQLIALLDRAWDTRSERVAHVRAVLPALKDRARISTELAVQLLRERTGQRSIEP